ncbi:MAG: hypothetical protein ACAH07_06145 [Methylophilaceae bacterium]|nr:hypothetical protein [Methyloradius sp.]
MIKFVIPTVLIAALFTPQAIAASCVLPVPDGGEIDPSPPSVKGVISKVAGHEIRLREQKSKPIKVVKETELFTVYGGSVEPEELKKGQHVFVWYVGCKKVHDVTPVAAIIQLCSIAAEPCIK